LKVGLKDCWSQLSLFCCLFMEIKSGFRPLLEMLLEVSNCGKSLRQKKVFLGLEDNPRIQGYAGKRGMLEGQVMG
jgi:hypothetical protein